MFYAADPASAKDLHHLVDLIDRGALHPHLASPRSWEQAADAIGELRAGGKIVLRVAG
jgi:NADPH:quinone reductase-like Zn-dependent oxidoreductase